MGVSRLCYESSSSLSQGTFVVLKLLTFFVSKNKFNHLSGGPIVGHKVPYVAKRPEVCGYNIIIFYLQPKRLIEYTIIFVYSMHSLLCVSVCHGYCTQSHFDKDVLYNFDAHTLM